jgi:HEPN domain-containing protein
MNNKIKNHNVRLTSPREEMFMNDREIGTFVRRSEEDYIIGRILSNSSNINIHFGEQALFHFQQSVEKYLKAFILLRGDTFKNEHNLLVLLKKCSQIDDYFKDQDLINGISYINNFYIVSRYPQRDIRAYVINTDEVVPFMDEFISNMRDKVRGGYKRNILDPIEEIKKDFLCMKVCVKIC